MDLVIRETCVTVFFGGGGFYLSYNSSVLNPNNWRINVKDEMSDFLFLADWLKRKMLWTHFIISDGTVVNVVGQQT